MDTNSPCVLPANWCPGFASWGTTAGGTAFHLAAALGRTKCGEVLLSWATKSGLTGLTLLLKMKVRGVREWEGGEGGRQERETDPRSEGDQNVWVSGYLCLTQ
eukprot:SAG22_NODE_9286_length_598_cov_2.565280_1_plen_102_part_01